MLAWASGLDHSPRGQLVNVVAARDQLVNVVAARAPLMS